MKKRQKGTLSTFFVEIIIVILSFSLATVIISNMFVSSSYNNRINRLRTRSINNASSIIEVYKIADSMDDCLKKAIDVECKYQKHDNIYKINLNEHMKYEEYGNIKLYIQEQADMTKAGVNKTINMKYIYDNREIYVIEGKKYEKK